MAEKGLFSSNMASLGYFNLSKKIRNLEETNLRDTMNWVCHMLIVRVEKCTSPCAKDFKH